MDKEFKKGDYVVYCPGYTEKVGRVAKDNNGNDLTLVCFHSGCTASSCSTNYLRETTKNELEWASKLQLGYYRFNKTCPDYMRGDVSCDAYCPEKSK